MTDSEVQRFRLYVIGDNPSSRRARFNFEKVTRDLFNNQVVLEVIDIKQNPSMAEDNHIVAVPTLVRISPNPCIKIIGDLTDIPTLRAFFGV
ncbi:MAG: circadian clock protein KaiB [Magnetococcales bacterium]|nr:circadian clock protein KaiB [Magnetococcales bacterium]NGZ28208.1 circadian clock protein KaiB [Magnetococcales bacterium]